MKEFMGSVLLLCAIAIGLIAGGCARYHATLVTSAETETKDLNNVTVRIEYRLVQAQ